VNETRASSLLFATAAEEISEDVDLWPSISASLVRRRSRPRGRRQLILAGLIMLTLVFSPAVVAASAQELYRQYGIVLVNPIEFLIPKQDAPGARPESAGASTPSLSLAEVQRQVSFRIPEPAWLPEGVVFRGALAGRDGSGVVLSYVGTHATASGGMFIQMQPHWSGGYVIPENVAQTAQVHGRPALYAPGGLVSGGWLIAGRWDTSIDQGKLSWQDESGLSYVLSYSGLRLSLEDLIRIAESMN